MRKGHTQFIPVFFVLSVTLAGCGKPVPPSTSLSEADHKLVATLENENDYRIILRHVGSTLWVYHPMRQNIIDVKASDKGPMKSNQAQESLSLKFVDANTSGKDFLVEYDIGKEKNYPKDYGYTSTYTEEYQKHQNNILSALSRTYFEVDPNKEKMPEFIVLIIADITKGIEIEATTYFDDFKRAMSAAPELPQDEYIKRYLTEVRGGKNIVEDTQGRHLDYREITLPSFLARQIVNRINFKYLQSSFPPSEDNIKEITQVIAETFGAYKFTDFNQVTLHDLAHDADITLTPADIEKASADLPKGRMVEIKFF